MANQVDRRTHLDNIIFAEIGPGGGLILSSGYLDGIGEDDEYEEMMIIGPVGVRNLLVLLDAQRSLTTHEADTGQICPSCKGESTYIFLADGKYVCARCNGTGHI